MMKKFHFTAIFYMSLPAETTRRLSRLLLLMLPWVMTLDGRGEGVGAEGAPAQNFDGCVWSTKDGVINLTPLANTDGTARFSHVLGQMGSSPWYYSYNPCFPFNEGTCAKTAVCQTDQGSTLFYDCGYSNTAQLSTDDGKPAIKYTADTTISRTSHVALVCDQSATEPKFVAIGDTGQGDYHFVLTTVCACPNGCGGDNTAEAEISIGTILVIIVLVVVVVYLSTGMIFNRVKHQKSGTELFPNREFWKVLPGTIKDGCTFTFSKVRGGCRGGSYQSV